MKLYFSNVFDILVCLGLPWFLKTVVQKPGSTVKVVHRGDFKKITINMKTLTIIMKNTTNMKIITSVIEKHHKSIMLIRGGLLRQIRIFFNIVKKGGGVKPMFKKYVANFV